MIGASVVIHYLIAAFGGASIQERLIQSTANEAKVEHQYLKKYILDNANQLNNGLENLKKQKESDLRLLQLLDGKLLDHEKELKNDIVMIDQAKLELAAAKDFYEKS